MKNMGGGLNSVTSELRTEARLTFWDEATYSVPVSSLDLTRVAVL